MKFRSSNFDFRNEHEFIMTATPNTLATALARDIIAAVKRVSAIKIDSKGVEIELRAMGGVLQTLHRKCCTPVMVDGESQPLSSLLPPGTTDTLDMAARETQKMLSELESGSKFASGKWKVIIYSITHFPEAFDRSSFILVV